MSRTREDILEDIEYCTKEAEDLFKEAEEAKQELKEFDKKEQG